MCKFTRKHMQSGCVHTHYVGAEPSGTCCLSFGGNKRRANAGQLLPELRWETGWPYETLYSPGEMNITHKTYRDLHGFIFHDGPQTPVLRTPSVCVIRTADTEKRSRRMHARANTQTQQAFGNPQASGIWNSNCQYKYLESIGHIKQKRESVERRGQRGTKGIRE